MDEKAYSYAFAYPADRFRGRNRNKPEHRSGGISRSRLIANKRKRIFKCICLAAAGLLTAAAMVMSLLAQAEITAISNETLKLEQEIKALEQEQTRLLIRRAEIYSPEALEEFAENELGMGRPNADQILYIDSSLYGR